jgi:hypothetical protein
LVFEAKETPFAELQRDAASEQAMELYFSRAFPEII